MEDRGVALKGSRRGKGERQENQENYNKRGSQYEDKRIKGAGTYISFYAWRLDAQAVKDWWRVMGTHVKRGRVRG